MSDSLPHLSLLLVNLSQREYLCLVLLFVCVSGWEVVQKYPVQMSEQLWEEILLQREKLTV